MARIIIEHDHADGLSTGTVIDPDRLPSRSIEAAAKAIETEAKKWPREDHPLGWGARTMPLGASLQDVAEAAIRAFLTDLLGEETK